MSTTPPQPSEAELRAYEDEIKRIRVEHVLFDGLVTLINLGMRRTGLMAGTEGERDASQVRLAIEAVRAHIPLVESVAPERAAPIRDALSQLQLAYVRIGGQAGPAGQQPPAGASAPGRAPAGASAPSGARAPTGPGGPVEDGGQGAASAAAQTGTTGTPAQPEAPQPPPKPGEPGPAQRSGRLWVPGS
ncbi:MAG: hypothetical protein ACLP0J_23325 [Solirubrobacteraceae bacterium]